MFSSYVGHGFAYCTGLPKKTYQKYRSLDAILGSSLRAPTKFCRTRLSSLDRLSLKLIADLGLLTVKLSVDHLGLILSVTLDPALPLSLLALILWLSLGMSLRRELMQECAHQVRPLQCQPPMLSMMLIS
jgi:hypothetical protein